LAGESGFAARCLLRAARWGSLATGAEGEPLASLVTHAVAPDGAVVMLLSMLAEHTKQLTAAPCCALMAVAAPENLNWQTAPRVTVIGEAVVTEDRELRAYWLARHPYAGLYAEFSDFALWRLMPERALYVGGFGKAARLGAASLLAPAEAVAAIGVAGREIVDHCNRTQGEALSRMAHAAGASGPWRMLGVDTDGVDLVQDEAVMRMAFDAPAADADGASAALQRLLGAARHRTW